MKSKRMDKEGPAGRDDLWHHSGIVRQPQPERDERTEPKGVLKEGYIIKQDSLHPDIYIYQFNVGDTTYSGQFHTPTAKNGNKMKFKNGDLIEVVYLKNNPNVNRRFNW